jgi:hypothetical protein
MKEPKPPPVLAYGGMTYRTAKPAETPRGEVVWTVTAYPAEGPGEMTVAGWIDDDPPRWWQWRYRRLVCYGQVWEYEITAPDGDTARYLGRARTMEAALDLVASAHAAATWIHRKRRRPA